MLFDGKCLMNAPNGYYKNKYVNSVGVEIFEFRSCSENCKTCNDMETCQICENDYRLLKGQCYKNCNQE